MVARGKEWRAEERAGVIRGGEWVSDRNQREAVFLVGREFAVGAYQGEFAGNGRRDDGSVEGVGMDVSVDGKER